MNKQTAVLIGVALVLATLYIAYFTDLFKQKNIQISWRISPANAGTVAFYLDKAYPLSSVQVISVDEAKTNKYPHPLWHLVASSAPPPTQSFLYGAEIPGMKPDISTALPETLQPDVNYSLIVVAASGIKSSASFSVH